MKKRISVWLSFLLLFAVPSFASVQTDYDHAVSFSQFHTYSWAKVHTNNDLWADRIRQAVDQQLQTAGWLRVVDGGDIVLLALGDSRTQQEEQTFYTGGGWRWGGGMATTSSYTTRNGVLVVSMVDAKTKGLVWRGTATGGLSDKPEKNIGKLNKAVSDMFKKFPPRP